MSTYLLQALSESDRRRGRKGVTIAGQPDAGPGRCRDPIPACRWSIDIAGGGVPETRWLPEMSQNGRGRRHRGSATREVQQLIGPQTTGREIAASSTPMLDVAGQSVDIACRCDREMASSSQVSGAVAHVSKCRLRMWRDRPPPSLGNVQARHQMQLISQWSFLFPIEADSSGCITRVISARRQKRLPLLPLPLRHATVLCFAKSVHLVCRPWLWWSKQAIDW